jgi:hypothetical protein
VESVRKPILEVQEREVRLRRLLKKPMQQLAKLQKVVDAEKQKAANIAAAKKKADAKKLRMAEAAAAIAKEASEAVGKGGGDGGGIAVLEAFLKAEAETRENPIVIDNYDLDLPDDDDDEDIEITSSTSDEKKSAGRKFKIKTSIAKSQGLCHGNTYEWPKNDLGIGAEQVFKQRYGIRNKNACALLTHDGTFVKDHEGKFYLVFGDVPFGYFRGLSHDVRFSRKQAVVILMGATQVLHKEGTIIIRIDR